MKRSCRSSMSGVALAAALVLGISAPSATRAESAARKGKEWLRVVAFTDAPVVGAEVRVTVGGRLLADRKATTNSQGVVPAPLSLRSLPGEEAAHPKARWLARIGISGGTVHGEPFLGHLAADVALTDLTDQIVVVNPVTTLESRLLEARPELKLSRAEVLVRRFLRLPDGYDLGLALRESSHYRSPFFSPIVFMREAREAGGLDAFEHLLIEEVALASPTHSFRNAQALEGGETSFAEELAKAALKYAGNQLAGWVMTQTGLATPDATAEGIDAMLESLNDLRSSVASLSSQVAQLTQLVKSTATQTQYDLITNDAMKIADRVNKTESDLTFFAASCPPAPESPVPPNPNPNQQWCDAWWPTYLSELKTSYQAADYETLEGYIQDNGTLGTAGMLHLYSLWLGQSKPFFRPADSTKMQGLYDYWDGVLTSAANLRIELFHQMGDQNTPAGEQQIVMFIGNPDVSPPTTGVFQADRTGNAKLMFPPVPVDKQSGGATVINTQDHTMWSLAPWVHSWPTPGNLVTWYPELACQLFNEIPIYVDGLPTVPTTPFSSYPYAGFSNWQIAPTKAQWQSAVSLAPTNGSVQWGDWLTQQTQTTDTETPASSGFFDWNRVCEGGNGTWVLDQGWNINLVTNKFANFDPVGPWYPTRTLAAGEQYFWYQ